MISKSKKAKVQLALKAYCKQYIHSGIKDLDESGTRLMINHFLVDVLGFKPIEEIKTEYMIRGTYADYVIQTKNSRHFLIEVKALSVPLSDKHLRQAINYGANEGIEWALLTNGKCFELYKILFNKPIESVRVFSVDFSDPAQIKNAAEDIQFLHRDVVLAKGLDFLWNKTMALDPKNIAGLLYSPTVTNFIRKTLRNKFGSKFSEDEVKNSIGRIIHESIKLEEVKPVKAVKKKVAPQIQNATVIPIVETAPMAAVN